MTSVAVISSAMARINCLKDLPKQSLLEEIGKILKSLETIKHSLEADKGVNAEVEKDIVRLSYDIVDAIADASSTSKDIFSGNLSILKTNGKAKLQQLHKNLNDFHDKLKEKNPERTGASPGSEVQARQQHQLVVSPAPKAEAVKEQQKPQEKSTASKLIPQKKDPHTTATPPQEILSGSGPTQDQPFSPGSEQQKHNGSEVQARQQHQPVVSTAAKAQADKEQQKPKGKSIISKFLPRKKDSRTPTTPPPEILSESGPTQDQPFSPGPEQQKHKEKSMISGEGTVTNLLDLLQKENQENAPITLSSKVEARPEQKSAVSPNSEIRDVPEQQKPKENSIISKLNPWKKKNSEGTSVPEETGPKGSEILEQEKVETDVDILPKINESLSNSTVVCIVGESGMGKSTLARKLFHKLQDERQFNVSAWIPINQNFQIKRVLRVLLQKLSAQQQVDMTDMNETELIAKIFAVLKNKNYLLVLDDVWAVEDWESIRLALPIADHTRIIITTGSKDFTKLDHSHQILGMTQSNILNLLEKETNLGPGLEEVGKAIFDISGGSPLFATILGKSICLDAATASQQQLVDELGTYRSMKGKPTVLGACYKKLAPELKPCLLYLGLFPQGQNIEVEKLYLLLAAENLLLPPKGSQVSIHNLIDNFKALALRKLVEVQEDIVSTRGNNKSYGLHDQILEFCKVKGIEEEFLEIFYLGSSTKVGPHTRRLAIYLNKYKGGDNSIQFESETLKKILSLMIFDSSESADQESDWPSEINDLREFIHLRILNFDGVDFNVRNVPRGLDKLVLLRYLSFRGCRLKEIPSSLSNLTQLETLDLAVQADCAVSIPKNVLTKMKRMLHLYFPSRYSSNGKLQLQNMERLEILVNFDTEFCDVKALSEFKNLKIISTMSEGQPETLNLVVEFMNKRGDGLQHSSVDIRSPDYYNKGSFSALEKLLDCKFIHSIQIQGQIGYIPAGHNGAENVTDMVLDGSEFEEDPMNYLGMFENLQSLVLRNGAFVGNEIVIAAAPPLFRNLRSLKFQNLEYVEKITIEKGAMPKLSTLQIDSCDLLQELSIPKELDHRLKGAQGDDRGATYSILPLPPKFYLIS